MQLIKQKLTIDFMSKRRLAYVFSGVLLLVALASVLTQGLKLGIDFTGGTLVEVAYPQPTEASTVRKVLAAQGFPDAVVQAFNSKDLLIRLAPQQDIKPSELSERVFSVLNASADGKVELRRQEFVGPQVGGELTEKGALAMIYTLILVLIYVAFRFEWRFAVGSVIALIHDVVITIGVFSLFQLEFDLSVLAAILAVLGYSLNDTIVVFDRIRENFRKMRKGSPDEITNRSLNQTLSRTLMTSWTTLIVLLSLFFLGGDSIHNFSLALIIGVFIGTYSSIYVASSSVLAMGISKEDLMPPVKEGADGRSDDPNAGSLP